MAAKTLRDIQIEALKGSIKKWEDIVAGTGEDDGPRNCPCCTEFRVNSDRPDCENCPIGDYSGEPYCRGTPYEYWSDYFCENDLDVKRVYDDETLNLAQQEVSFLTHVLTELEASQDGRKTLRKTLRETQIEALKGSIKKWEDIVEHMGVDNGIHNCPCCQEFYMKTEEGEECLRCPVSLRSGDTMCANTPYITFVRAAAADAALGAPRRANSRKAMEAARAELKYLQETLGMLEAGELDYFYLKNKRK